MTLSRSNLQTPRLDVVANAAALLRTMSMAELLVAQESDLHSFAAQCRHWATIAETEIKTHARARAEIKRALRDARDANND